MHRPASCLAVLLAAAGELAAQQGTCVSEPVRGPVHGDSVRLFLDPEIPSPAVVRALAAWANCPEYGWGFPALQLTGEGTRELWLDFDPRATGEGRCGAFTGRRIVLFARMRTATGEVLPCGALDANLAHELGHALGLADARGPGCRHHAMASIDRRRGDRRPQPAECAALDRHWSTWRERTDLRLAEAAAHDQLTR